jgi:CheY-like chemotaxis protein
MAKFLVVEDEPDACKALAEVLTQSGGAVRSCESGTQAIELCRKERVDLVFCDLKLPGLDGLAVLEAIKRIDPWATIIVVTGYGSVDSATHALRLGAYDFVEKPFTTAQIQQVARRAMDHRHTLAQLAHLQGKPGSAADVPAQLVQTEQLKSDFFTLVIRELRTPFKLLSEELCLAKEGFYGDWSPAQQQFLNRLGRVQTMLLRFIQGGLALFLGHQQRVTFTRRNIPLLLEELMIREQLRCKEKGIRLQTKGFESDLEGILDAEKTLSIAGELLDNALNTTPAGGKIRVTLSKRPTGFFFCVSHSAEALTQLHRFWTDADLGLTLVRHYVDLLGGKIRLASLRKCGTTLALTLPWGPSE